MNSGTVIVQCIALIRVVHRHLLLTKLCGITSLQVIKMLFRHILVINRSPIRINLTDISRNTISNLRQTCPYGVVLGVNFLRLTDLINEGTDILKKFRHLSTGIRQGCQSFSLPILACVVQISYRFFYFIYRVVQYRLLFKQVLCKRPVNLRSHRKSIQIIIYRFDIRSDLILQTVDGNYDYLLVIPFFVLIESSHQGFHLACDTCSFISLGIGCLRQNIVHAVSMRIPIGILGNRCGFQSCLKVGQCLVHFI